MSVKIVFKEEDEKLFWEQWDRFVNGKKLSSRYSEINIKHLLTFLENIYSDKSFFNKKIIYGNNTFDRR